MELFKFGYRNLWRQKRRTIINLFMIGFAVVSILLFNFLFAGEKRDIVNNIVNFGIGHIQIHRKAYDKESGRLPLNLLIQNYDEIISKLQTQKDIAGITPRLISGGLLSFGRKIAPVSVEGIDIENESNVSIISPEVVKGEFLKKGEYGILIGKELANLLEVKRGDIVFLYCKTALEANNLIDLEVKGIYDVGYSNFEKIKVFLPLGILQKLLDVKGVSGITIVLNKIDEVDKEKNTILSMLGGDKFEVFTWKHYAPEIEEIITLWDGSNAIIKFILFMIAIFGIVNTMLMNVWERKKEIGTLRALGYSRREIRTLFIIESFWTGVMGVLVGWVIAFAVGLYLQMHGIVIPMEAFQGMINIPFGNVIYGKMCVSHFINIFIWGVIITIIAGLIPAVKASRMNIVDSLKEY